MPEKNARAITDIRRQLRLFEQIFDNIPSGAMITDPLGTVTHLNKPYARFLGIEAASGIGRHCTEVVENSRMHIVGQTGLPEINQIQNIRGQNIVVHRIPIRQDGQIIAVFGLVMFQHISEAEKLVKRMASLESKVKCYERQLRHLHATRYTLDSIIGVSPQILSLKQEAQIAASNSSPVLITGESGTGKEVFAQAIHHASPRKLLPFIHLNCAAIPKDLLESELFGYERGAFTGAHSGGKVGKFELADQGTIFLDEIGDLPLDMQPKLLRVLEEKCFERVGGNTVIRSDFRLIAATNQDLPGLIETGRFRHDLYYRLNVMALNIAPLRQRREDIGPLTRHLLGKLAHRHGYNEIPISGAAEAALAGHSWPGNVRELANVLERAALARRGEEIQEGDLPVFHRPLQTAFSPAAPLRSVRSRQQAEEKETLLAALRQTGNNKAQAAALLGIHRTLLYKKMKKFAIDLQQQL